MDRGRGSGKGVDDAIKRDDGILFETRDATTRYGVALKLFFMFTILVGILMIWYYRVTNIVSPTVADGFLMTRWLWMAVFAAEVWFGLYWVITQPVRLKAVSQHPFKNKLLQRYGDALPSVDIFVCTADPKMEPRVLVINTVLSAMSYNYPPENLNVYLSDDGGSELTFYALIEAARFSKQWIPFCRRFQVEPRSPGAFFAAKRGMWDDEYAQKLQYIKELFDKMKNQIGAVTESGSIPEDFKALHKGFAEWNSEFTKQNHQSVVQIIIDGRGGDDVDVDGCRLPRVVYMAREKRPEWSHNFKAGAVNALLRVSSEISNSPLILTLDCDMYPNNPDTILETLCFFMDEERGHEIAYVQFPQHYNNITKNDLYANSNEVINEIELAGLGGYGAALYCGTGCFHRRESLWGRKFSKDSRVLLYSSNNRIKERTVDAMEEAAKVLAECSYEKGSSWGKEMGLVYGCAVEDIVTGLTIQCRGWKSAYYNPKQKAFIGVAPTTLNQGLIQYRRWSEGMFQIFFSKFCPFTYAWGKLGVGAQMGYCIYLLWAPCSFAVLCYVIVPPLCLIRGIPLFPKVSSLWFLPFAYVFTAKYAYSLVEAVSCECSLQGWWNLQRMWLVRRTTCYLYSFLDILVKRLGFSETSFSITGKVADNDEKELYEQEIIDFGNSTFTSIIVTLAMLNLCALATGLVRVLTSNKSETAMNLTAQIILCGLIVLINLPVYAAVFNRQYKGGPIPSSTVTRAVALVSVGLLTVNFVRF